MCCPLMVGSRSCSSLTDDLVILTLSYILFLLFFYSELEGIYHKKIKLDLVISGPHATLFKHNSRQVEDVYFSNQANYTPIPQSNFYYPVALRGKGYRHDGRVISSKTPLKIKPLLTQDGLVSKFASPVLPHSCTLAQQRQRGMKSQRGCRSPGA